MLTDPADPWVISVFTVLIVGGFFASTFQMGRLLFGFLSKHEKVPTLLWRDATFFFSVMGVITANYIWLVAGYTAPMRPLWWTVLSGIVLTLAAWTYVIFGIRRIFNVWRDRHPPKE